MNVMNNNNEMTWGDLQNFLAALTEEQLQMVAIVFDSDTSDIILISEVFVEPVTNKPILKI